MAGSKFMSQVSALSDTGLNMAANGFNQKAKAPTASSALHGRGLAKPHVTAGAHPVSVKHVPNVANSGSPKAPANHPAVAKNSSGKPSVKFG